MADAHDALLTIATERTADGTTVLTVVGEIDLDTARLVRDAVASARSAGAEHIAFRMDRVDFIDSSGLAALLESRSTDGTIRVIAPSAAVERLIVSTGLADIIVAEP